MVCPAGADLRYPSTGGQVLTETEESCVVYGMPRCVLEAGISSGQASIDEMPAAILKML